MKLFIVHHASAQGVCLTSVVADTKEQAIKLSEDHRESKDFIPGTGLVDMEFELNEAARLVTFWGIGGIT